MYKSRLHGGFIAWLVCYSFCRLTTRLTVAKVYVILTGFAEMQQSAKVAVSPHPYRFYVSLCENNALVGTAATLINIDKR